MSQPDLPTETFEEFKKSFSYGTRSNMNFKFLNNLSNGEVGEFFKQLAQELGESFDNGDLQKLYQFVVEWQARGYAARGNYAYADSPFAPLSKPVARSRLMLLTSSGRGRRSRTFGHPEYDPAPSRRND
jgi:hypothetical protein